jgi:indolepyruvate decarboxylase
VRLGLNPVIVILNNDGYGTMRRIRDGSFNVITQWDYSQVCNLVGGGKSVSVSTKGEFDEALAQAQTSEGVFVIELKLPPNSTSLQLSRIADEVRKVRGTGPAS